MPSLRGHPSHAEDVEGPPTGWKRMVIDDRGKTEVHFIPPSSTQILKNIYDVEDYFKHKSGNSLMFNPFQFDFSPKPMPYDEHRHGTSNTSGWRKRFSSSSGGVDTSSRKSLQKGDAAEIKGKKPASRSMDASGPSRKKNVVKKVTEKLDTEVRRSPLRSMSTSSKKPEYKASKASKDALDGKTAEKITDKKQSSPTSDQKRVTSGQGSKSPKGTSDSASASVAVKKQKLSSPSPKTQRKIVNIFTEPIENIPSTFVWGRALRLRDSGMLSPQQREKRKPKVEKVDIDSADSGNRDKVSPKTKAKISAAKPFVRVATGKNVTSKSTPKKESTLKQKVPPVSPPKRVTPKKVESSLGGAGKKVQQSAENEEEIKEVNIFTEPLDNIATTFVGGRPLRVREGPSKVEIQQEIVKAKKRKNEVVSPSKESPAGGSTVKSNKGVMKKAAAQKAAVNQRASKRKKSLSKEDGLEVKGNAESSAESEDEDEIFMEMEVDDDDGSGPDTLTGGRGSRRRSQISGSRESGGLGSLSPNTRRALQSLGLLHSGQNGGDGSAMSDLEDLGGLSESDIAVAHLEGGPPEAGNTAYLSTQGVQSISSGAATAGTNNSGYLMRLRHTVTNDLLRKHGGVALSPPRASLIGGVIGRQRIFQSGYGVGSNGTYVMVPKPASGPDESEQFVNLPPSVKNDHCYGKPGPESVGKVDELLVTNEAGNGVQPSLDTSTVHIIAVKPASGGVSTPIVVPGRAGSPQPEGSSLSTHLEGVGASEGHHHSLLNHPLPQPSQAAAAAAAAALMGESFPVMERVVTSSGTSVSGGASAFSSVMVGSSGFAGLVDMPTSASATGFSGHHHHLLASGVPIILPNTTAVSMLMSEKLPANILEEDTDDGNDESDLLAEELSAEGGHVQI